jgi:hypothetical protein
MRIDGVIVSKENYIAHIDVRRIWAESCRRLSGRRIRYREYIDRKAIGHLELPRLLKNFTPDYYDCQPKTILKAVECEEASTKSNFF